MCIGKDTNSMKGKTSQINLAEVTKILKNFVKPKMVLQNIRAN